MYITLAYVARQSLDEPGLSLRTRKLYEGILLNFLDQYGRKLIKTITRDDIVTYLHGLTHLNVRTHHLHQSVINRLFNYAIERGWLDNNPVSRIKRRKPDALKGEYASDEVVRYLMPQQIKVLTNATRSNKRLHALIWLIYESGTRISEVLALDMDQINFTKGEFRVTGKGNKVRQCYFGERTSVALRDYIETAKDNTHKALFTERMKSTHLVRRLSYQTAHRDLRDVTSRHKVLKDVRFHDLRHTFATERARIVPIEVLRALLGHEKIQTTLIYQKITSQVARESAMLALKQIAESLH